jgi:hypothetical protein
MMTARSHFRTSPVIRFLLAVVLACAAQTVSAQNVYVRDAGPGASGRILRSVLAGQRTVVVRQDSTLLELPADSVFPSSLVILGSDATIEGTVHGDLIVVDGDLFLHPGSRIDGRAVAVGGCVYNSTLAFVGHGLRCFRDNTFTMTQTSRGIALDYRALGYRDSQALVLPGLFGVRIPSYDRVNGLSLPFGPMVRALPSPIEIDALARHMAH